MGKRFILLAWEPARIPPQEILDAGARAFVQKPFSRTTPSEKMQEVIGGFQASKVNQGFFSWITIFVSMKREICHPTGKRTNGKFKR